MRVEPGLMVSDGFHAEPRTISGKPVAVDIHRRGTDIIGPRLAIEYDALLPGGVFVPDHLVLIDHDNVRLFVAVNVRGQDRVADFQPFIDLLSFEFWEIGREYRR